ncbi:MAG TPA: 23S rRNA (pseudouridine(1915)-N(3))-methyltransferase RlmH [Gemmatimonadales bacterium]|nr:23S rRNA (pseudouridine(1915)-N(3))-methyltransferase RlmH [Gemmatimonadales bacterium]
MVVRVVAVGRLRHAGLRDLCDEYRRRAERGLRIEVREVAEAGRRGGTPAEARRLEAERLRAAVPAGTRLVALTRAGRALASDDFAALVGRWREEARDVALLLGGAFGLDAGLLARAELRLSLSPFTLPHELARVVLMEQLYRAVSILRGDPYHKGAAP